MRILLTQQEWIKPPNSWIMDAVERSWYDLLRGHIITTAPNLPDSVPEVPYWDCLVLTGGPDSVARHLTENALMRVSLAHGTAVLGVCHGAFAINDYLGGTNVSITGHAGTQHDVILDHAVYRVNSYHHQSLEKLAPGLVPRASTTNDVIEAFAHESRPIWGMVWHPERQDQPVMLPEVISFLLSS